MASPTIQQLFDLTGQVALVIGGARNLGYDMALALAEAGAEVAQGGNRHYAHLFVFRAGDNVFHKTFGTGVVLSVSPMGNDMLLEIVFDKIGTKKLMANFARLEKR